MLRPPGKESNFLDFACLARWLPFSLEHARVVSLVSGWSFEIYGDGDGRLPRGQGRIDRRIDRFEGLRNEGLGACRVQDFAKDVDLSRCLGSRAF